MNNLVFITMSNGSYDGGRLNNLSEVRRSIMSAGAELSLTCTKTTLHVTLLSIGLCVGSN